jgi:adenylate cyclase
MTAIHPTAQALFDWLVDGAPGAPTPMAVLARVGPDLVASGVPLERIVAFVRTLHPSVMGRRFVWLRGVAEVTASEASWETLQSPGFANGPVARVFSSGEVIRTNLTGTQPLPSSDLEQLRAEGYTELLALPLKFMGGSTHGITFCTRQRGGFSEAHLATMLHVVRPLSRVGETLALMRTAVNLLNAYVGNDAGDRILKGQIQRGDTENIRCVIWFSDLRGFTTLSGDRTPKEIIGVLNEFFECQVPAIERDGGQVLKFIGDGLLAMFPVDATHDAKAAGDGAVRAAKSAFEALGKLNTVRAARGEGALAFGVALHLGDVAYGNIGGASRLDFTAIGPAVNLASRIESTTGKLGKAVLISAELAKVLSISTQSVGMHGLKGIAAPVELFEPT